MFHFPPFGLGPLGYTTFIPLEFTLVFINTTFWWFFFKRMFDIGIYFISPSLSCSLKLTDLLLTALENPVKYIEDNVEQKVNLPDTFSINGKAPFLEGGSF